jgi:hypothetical protein
MRRFSSLLLLAVLSAGILRAETSAAARSPAARTPARGAFAVRMVKLSAHPSSDEAWEHLKFCVGEGFNALWVYSSEAGAWTPAQAPKGPWINPAFVRMAKWCRAHGVRVVVSVNPVADSRLAFVFSEDDGEKRIARFLRLLRDQAGVREFVVSFDDQPSRLKELSDVLRYGVSSAPAHLDLAARLERSLRRDESLWLCAAVYSDQELGEGRGPYTGPFLDGLARLPARVGIVWTGPRVVSPSISGADIAATRARLGGRKILLYDNYPFNDDFGSGIGLILGPLRRRSADLPGQVAAYLSCPMTQLAASRLPLMTVADYLADPGGYDPRVSSARAIASLAGPDRNARAALTVQASEWGAWIGEPGYQSALDWNPEIAAEQLEDPATRADWTETEIVYPDRMRALKGLADASFRSQLIEAMERRLAIARAVRPTREYRAREAAGLGGLAPILESLAAQRRTLTGAPGALQVFDEFLQAEGVPAPRLAPPAPE